MEELRHLWNIIFSCIAVFLGIITLLTYVKLQALRKPPGCLIFIQLCYLLGMQLVELYASTGN